MTKQLLACLCWCAALAAYNPPMDVAGPVTLRMQEPALGAYGSGGLADLSRPGVPVSLPVSLENAGASEIRGTVRVGVIDRWRVSPAGPVSFTLPPKGRARLEFQISFGEGTHNAHYPVHAFAEFTSEGKPLVAHAILVLTPRQPNPPRAQPEVEWKPARVPSSGGLALWRLRARRDSLRIEQQAGRETYEAAPVVQPGARAGREAIAVALGMRPPSLRERVASATAAFPVALPDAKPLRLRFATAVSDPAKPASFRVRSGEDVLFERRAATSAWEEAEVDLGSLADRTVELRLESEAGDWPGSAQAFWAEPTVVAGNARQRAAFPPQAAASSRLLGKAGAYEVRVWPGERGALDAAVGFLNGSRQLYFSGFRVRVLGDRLDDWRSVTEFLEAREEPAAGHYRVRHRFDSWAGRFDIVADLWVEGGALRSQFRLENGPKPRPWVDAHMEEVAAGPWSERAGRVYGGPGNVIRNPQAFQLGFDGHRLATSFVGFDFPGVSLVAAVDVPPDRLEVDPEARIYALSAPHSQTMTFIPAADVWSGVKQWRTLSGVRAAAGVSGLAGRFVFDLWRGRYQESARGLERAFRYGLTDAAVVWHSWQRWGYDYRLPDIYPPNPQFGTAEEFHQLVETCRKHGALFAPHDNYIDFYPDSDGFSYGNIVFEPDGRPRRAWFNYGRQAQSYRARADRVRPFLERNIKLLAAAFAPTAYFIDVWSSIAPYDYWTEDGRFIDRLETRREWRDAFAWIRDFLGGAPQISEAGHDQLIGWLDGAQANHLRVDATSGRSFVWPIRCADAERIPWMDAAYHDTFILHGAGYAGRYSDGLDERSHGIYSDDYMATEVLTGRPAMVAAPFSRDVIRKYWLLHAPMRALALRRLETFEFADGDLHRQRVGWDGGGEVFVNRGASEWTASGHALPQYGFYLRLPGQQGVSEAAVERLGDATVEWSRSSSALYVNARGKTANAGPVSTSGGVLLDAEGGALRVVPLPDSPRFTIRLRWSALPWKLPRPRQVEALAENGAVVKRSEAAAAGDEVTLECEPGVFAYRLR